MRSYFFDAHVIGTTPAGAPIFDREYYAADHANFYKPFFSNGLFLIPDRNAGEVTVTGVATKTLEVAPGVFFINGYQGATEGDDKFPTIALANGYYRVVIRLDKSEAVRAFICALVFGSETEYPALTRFGNIYELAIANVIIQDGVPTTVEDTRFDPELCGALSFAGLPPYYPPTTLPEILWLYTMFPETLTPEQITLVEENPSLMDIFDANRMRTDARPTDWQLLQEYTTAGTFQWIAPDVYSDGQTYEIGVFIIGAGAGGGVRCYFSQTAMTDIAASGGASGYTTTDIRNVIPGTSFNVVVGAKGTPATISVSDGANYNGGAIGGAGGSSSFAGVIAYGGNPGTGVYPSNAGYIAAGADGGQGSDLVVDSGGFGRDATGKGTSVNLFLKAPAMGRSPIVWMLSQSGIYMGSESIPGMCINPFNGRAYLGAGGGVNVSSSGIVSSQTAPALGDRKSAGAGRGTNLRYTITGYDATSPGSGGGALAVTAASLSGAVTLTAGAGAPGAVLLYVRRSVR